MTGPIGVGIVGTGRMAETMARAIARRRDLRVVAVGSSDPARAESFARRAAPGAAARDPAGLLADPAVDLVYVANRTRDHAASSLAALAAGKHVLCEKPCAVAAADARRLAEAARAADRFFMEAMWTMALPAWRRMSALAASGRLGTPRRLAFDFGYPASETDRARLYGPEDGGVLAVRGCYGVALALDLLGDVATVEADPGAGGDADAAIRLRHAAGGVTQLTVSATTLLSNAATLACTEGMVALAPPAIGGERVLWTRQPTASGARGGVGAQAALRRLPAARRLREALGGPRRERRSWGADPYDPMLSHVAETLASGARRSALMPPAASVAVAEALEAARRAAGA